MTFERLVSSLRSLFFFAACTACATGGSRAAPAPPPASSSTPTPVAVAPSEDAGGPAQPTSTCSGSDLDLAAILASRRCRPPRDAPAAPASAKNDLAISLTSSAATVAPGGHVDLTLQIENHGAAAIPLYFSGDLTLAVEVTDPSGTRIAPPPGNAPKSADPKCMTAECRLPASHLVLPPGGRAHATVGWDATRKIWPSTGPTTCCTFHVDAVAAGPLPEGAYRVKIPLPFESNHDNPADAEIAVRVAK